MDLPRADRLFTIEDARLLLALRPLPPLRLLLRRRRLLPASVSFQPVSRVGLSIRRTRARLRATRSTTIPRFRWRITERIGRVGRERDPPDVAKLERDPRGDKPDG